MKQCLITAIHALLLKKSDNNSSDKFLTAVEQSGCEERLYKARPQVVMRWLTSFWVNACKDKVVVSDKQFELLYNAKSYAAWLSVFETLFLKAIKENALPTRMPTMPAYYTFE